MENLQTFAANGVELHYSQSGSGKPLLFIPGSISDYRTWEGIRAHFEKTHRCFVLSRRFQFPGHYVAKGDSSVDANTEDIAAFIRGMNLAPVTLVGHSFGAFVALNLAIRYPELVEKVVAEEPIFAPALASNPKNPLQLLSLLFRNFKAGKSFARLGMKGVEPTFKALAAGDTTTAQKTFIDGVTDGKKTPETLDELTRRQLEDNIAALAGEDPFINKIKLSDAKKIACKVLLLSGTESPYAFRFINEQLEKNIPKAQHHVFQGASHWIHIDQAGKFSEMAGDFIKN